MKDEELMLNYQKGDMQAMNELLSRYKNPIYNFAYRLSQNYAEAQDITQEVFFKIHQCRDTYTPCGSFAHGYLALLIIYSSAGYVRKSGWYFGQESRMILKNWLILKARILLQRI